MQRRLQPDAAEAATLCGGGCNPTWWRLQPYVVAAATLCGGGCSPTWWRLQPYVVAAAALRLVAPGQAEHLHAGGQP